MSTARKIGQDPLSDERTRQALSHLVRGTATSAEQRIGMKFIIGTLCGIGAAQPAVITEREAGFLSGSQWVGIFIAKLAGLDLWTAQTEEDGPQ